MLLALKIAKFTVASWEAEIQKCESKKNVNTV
jgi:hypothetical protein